jgi:hypothetical protein
MDHEMCKYYIPKRTRLEKCLTGLAVYELAEISLCTIVPCIVGIEPLLTPPCPQHQIPQPTYASFWKGETMSQTGAQFNHDN